jgi:hypothetical protein
MNTWKHLVVIYEDHYRFISYKTTKAHTQRPELHEKQVRSSILSPGKYQPRLNNTMRGRFA